LQVAAIALVIGLGTGSYAGLSNVTEWRRTSTDDGYRDLAMHDLRVRVAEGSVLPQGALLEVAALLPGLENAEERLVIDLQVDASTADQTILIPGTLYGVAAGEHEPSVDGFSTPAGRGLTEADRGEPRILLEHHFAKHYDLAPSGTVRVSGGRELEYVGQALTPEYFIVTTERGGLLAEANFAALFASLETAQEVAGKGDVVNDLVLTLGEGTDRSGAAAALEALLAERLPGVGAQVMTREEDPSFRLNDADIKGDQQVYDIFALLMFAGAVVAAFNLIARVVESQRREIGLAMVFGVRPLRIAVRPLLVAAEIALVGVAFGIGVGMLIGLAMASVLRDLQPLPEWQTPFLPGVFLAVGLAGFLLPFLATTWPVWRAVRVAPVHAIQPAYRLSRAAELPPLLRRLRVPGNTFTQVPIRNVVRTPRRSLLTTLGIAAALAALIAFVGLIDSFLSTIDRAENEVLSSSPGRVEVALDGFYPASADQVAAIVERPEVSAAEPQLRLESVMIHEGEEVSLQVDVLPLDSQIWQPKIVEGEIDTVRAGIYLSRLAAATLGLEVGDIATLRHPRLAPDGTFALVETELPVLGLHPHPFRFIAYMDSSQADLFNLAGTTNLVQVVPAPDATADEVKRALFELPGVTSVQGVNEVARAIDELLGEFVLVLRVVEGAMLLLALLIAFNSASINMDERAREHATMFAFGVPVRTVMRMAILENLILGVFASSIGVLSGWLLLRLIIRIRIPETLPDIDVPPVISPSTLALALVLGVLAVGLAPLLTIRRLRQMNVPATLKVFE
jgi:putative ABC transport system permease protein